ncbi:hypothetical protein [Brevundimonas sp.]|uniref:hypothetical protein n=1 Tax=Brevundimonas sp. TaxID=1871086 RepID=UPI003BACD34B
MKHIPLLACLLPITASLVPASAVAQDGGVAENWTVTRLRSQETVIAATSFDNGITVMSRCMNNVFGLVMMGLPPVQAGVMSRPLTLIVGDEEEKSYIWNVAAADPGTALSRVPAVLARRLAKGGRMQIIVPAEAGGRRTRYIVELPASGSGVNETLSRCGRPLEDPRDDRLIGDGANMAKGYVWLRQPRPEFPAPTVHGATNGGLATLSCDVLVTGRVTDCQVEDEFPVGFGFGQAARRAAAQALIGQTDEARADGQPFEPGRILFSTTFMLR